VNVNIVHKVYTFLVLFHINVLLILRRGALELPRH